MNERTDRHECDYSVRTLLSTSFRSIWDWTMYMSASTNPVHSLSLRLASLRSELTFLREKVPLVRDAPAPTIPWLLLSTRLLPVWTALFSHSKTSSRLLWWH